MPKKAAGSQQEEKQVSEAAFLKSFDKTKAAASQAATKERATFLTDMDILQKLGVGPDERITVAGTVSKINMSFAKNDANRPMFRFVYVIVSDDKNRNGVVVSNNFIIEEGTRKDGTVWQTIEEAMEKLFFEFQGLGEDTAAWAKTGNPMAKAVAAAKEHTKNKTPVSLTISHYVSDAGKHGMNVRVNPGVANDNSDLEASEDGEESDDFNADDWLGGWVEFDHDEYGHVRMKVDSYDSDSHTFAGTADNGDAWEGEYAPSADIVEWSENQDD